MFQNAKENANNITLNLKSRHKAVSDTNQCRCVCVHTGESLKENTLPCEQYTKYFRMRELRVMRSLYFMSQMFYDKYYFDTVMLFILVL